jgi:hypothetical protein
MRDPDFRFRFNRSSLLEGRGWRGLIALAMLLAACGLIGSGLGPSLSAAAKQATHSLWAFL